MNDLYLAAFMLLLGFVLNFAIFPRNKTINVADDYIGDQKVKDNRKIKNRGKESPKIIYDDFSPPSVLIDGLMSRREVIKLWKSIKNK